MLRHLIPTAIAALLVAIPATAEQFAIRLDTEYQGANEKLKQSLQVSEIDSFSEDDTHYVVLDAPGVGYVEAFFYAIGQNAIELHVLEADWTLPAMRRLPVSQRLGFLRAVECEFCTS